jgi:hypothetical protein
MSSAYGHSHRHPVRHANQVRPRPVPATRLLGVAAAGITYLIGLFHLTAAGLMPDRYRSSAHPAGA